MREKGRHANREARGGAGTGRCAATRGQRGTRRRWGEGDAGTGRCAAAAGGREARVQKGRGRARGVIASGCIQYRECTQVHFSAAVCIYIYIYISPWTSI
jgi:hypothetical protein